MIAYYTPHGGHWPVPHNRGRGRGFRRQMTASQGMGITGVQRPSMFQSPLCLCVPSDHRDNHVGWCATSADIPQMGGSLSR